MMKLKQRITTELPYDEWVKEHVIHLSEITQADESDVPAVDDLFKQQQTFGYTPREIWYAMIVPMARMVDPCRCHGCRCAFGNPL